MLTISTQTPDLLEREGWWLRFLKHYPVTSPPTNQKKVMPLATLPQMLPLNTLPWKPSGNLRFLSKSHLYSLLAACNKHCTFLHHNPMSVNWLCCMVDEQTQMWFGNTSPSWITARRVTSKYKFLMWCLQQPTWASLPHLPGTSPSVSVDNTPEELDNLPPTCSFWFELTNLALAQEPQSNPPMDPNKGMCPRSCPLPLPAPSLNLPLGPPEGCFVLPPDPESKKLPFCWTGLGLYLTNVNLTKPQQYLLSQCIE